MVEDDGEGGCGDCGVKMQAAGVCTGLVRDAGEGEDGDVGAVGVVEGDAAVEENARCGLGVSDGGVRQEAGPA